MHRTDKTLDIKGLVSPRTELITEKMLTALEPGQVLTVVTTDRTIRQKLPLLCRILACTLLEMTEEGGALYVYIQKIKVCETAAADTR